MGNDHACRVLFLCTGNYYRSRFAEELFNHLAAQAGLRWEAGSRGIATELGVNNVGPISPHAVRGLQARGVHIRGAGRYPQQLQVQDLEKADRVIALNETEHRRLLHERFPGWIDRMEYWRVNDLDLTPPETALARIETRIRELIARLVEENE